MTEIYRMLPTIIDLHMTENYFFFLHSNYYRKNEIFSVSHKKYVHTKITTKYLNGEKLNNILNTSFKIIITSFKNINTLKLY